MSTINCSEVVGISTIGVYSVKTSLTNVTKIRDGASADTFGLVNCFNTSAKFNYGGFKIESNGVTVPVTGVYMFGCSSYYEATEYTGSNDRVCVQQRFYNDTLSSSYPYIASQSYIRNYSTDKYSSSYICIVQQLTAGNKIRLQYARSADATIDVKLHGNNSEFWMFKI
tara:strand:+ start:16 stop:522 length:507 start_codon:yes stop_codon:yes gene_type:complete